MGIKNKSEAVSRFEELTAALFSVSKEWEIEPWRGGQRGIVHKVRKKKLAWY